MNTMRADADQIIREAIAAVLPDEAVRKALDAHPLSGRIFLVSIGKAGWQMAHTAAEKLGSRLTCGVIVTKYGHSRGAIPRCAIIEAGHPVPDENSRRGAEAALRLVSGVRKEDTVLFLISGGGSALFEKSLIPLEQLQQLTRELLASGADITEINTIRKRLSAVKGGRFAALCSPAKVFCVVLSDVLGDRLDMIASGPACPDGSTCADALKIAQKYGLKLSEETRRLLETETPKHLDRVETVITGSAGELCRAVAKAAEKLQYRPVILTDCLCCEAREAGGFLASMAQYRRNHGPVALIAGGETVVHLTGRGLGGRNQELALAAAAGIRELPNTAIFSVGSDGTDGPTDAAGGYVDGSSADRLREAGLDISQVLQDNDSYHALERIGGLIRTGPTGTNVNDVSVVLIR